MIPSIIFTAATTGSITANRVSHKALAGSGFTKGQISYLLFFFQVNAEKTAVQKEPNNPMVLINVARVNHELENYGTAQIMDKN